MKHFFFYICFLLIASLTLPGAVFLPAGPVYEETSTAKLPVVADPVKVLVVSAPESLAVVLPSARAEQTSTCAFTAGQQSVVESPSIVNLDQPANCFRLDAFVMASALQTRNIVAVTENLNVTGKVAVARHSPLLAEVPRLMPFTANSNAALPAAVFSVLLALVLFERKKNTTKTLRQRFELPVVFKTPGFAVLRC